MQIKRRHTLIELTEVGLKLEINADSLLNSLITEKTQEWMRLALTSELNNLLERFYVLYDSSTQESFEKLKENRNEDIYKYACLSRDLYGIVGDVFDELYENNSTIMSYIGSIYKYSSVYGFKGLGSIDVP